ncbi:MAG: response regulator [Thermoplasmatales archaeon]|nr:response regulator [Thermoplasmatales archaeon]
MKVLIVDDNPAILEIISDILQVNGYETSTAEDADDARAKLVSFKPGILILDSSLHGEPSFPLLGEIDLDSDLKVLILTSGNETLPTDSKFIRGSLKSPYRSSEVLEEVRRLGPAGDQKAAVAVPQKEAKRKKKGFFRRRNKEKIVPARDATLRHGKSYVVFEDTPETAYRLAFALAMQDADVAVVTDENPKAVKERFLSGNVTVKGLSMRPRPGYVEASKPGTIMHEAMEFIKGSQKPVLVFSNLDLIVQVNGINAALTLIHQIRAGAGKQISMVVSSSGEGFTSKDRDLLVSGMELYKQQGREQA